MTRFAAFVLKTAALLSFCGGPLVIADELKPNYGTLLAMAVTFAPIVAMLFGTFSLGDAEHEPVTQLDVVCVYAGAAGAVLLLGMDGYGGWRLATGRERADAGLIQLGIAIGLIAVGFYAVRARRFLAALGR